MATTMTIKERTQREDRVKGYIAKGLSQKEIAEKLGVSPQAISKFLRLRGWATARRAAD